MRAYWILGALAVLLTGCSNFSLFAVGIPTVVISPGPSTPNSPTQPTEIQINYTIQSVPGSPGGVLVSLNLKGGGTLTGGPIYACPQDTPSSQCPITNVAASFTSPSGSVITPGSVVAVSYTVQGENGAVRTFQLPQPITFY
jgi:hypothetical protein